MSLRLLLVAIFTTFSGFASSVDPCGIVGTDSVTGGPFNFLTTVAIGFNPPITPANATATQGQTYQLSLAASFEAGSTCTLTTGDGVVWTGGWSPNIAGDNFTPPAAAGNQTKSLAKHI